MAREDLDTADGTTSVGNRRGSHKKALPSSTEDKSRFRKYAATIDSLKITDVQREFLKNRWFDQVDWMSNEAAKNRRWYELLRSIVIIGSAIVPTLVTFGSLTSTFGNGNPQNTQSMSFEPSSETPAMPLSRANDSGFERLDTVSIASSQSQLVAPTPTNPLTVGLSFINPSYVASFAAFILSQLVAICAAIDQFFKYGDRWRHYRRSVELLKSDGWQFFQLTGPYAIYAKKGGHEEAFTLFANQVESIIRSDVEGYINQIAAPKQLNSRDQDDSDSS